MTTALPSDPPERPRLLRAWQLPTLVVPLVAALPLFAGRVFLYRDTLIFAVPQQAFAAGALRAGRLPQWNPLLFGGAPFLSEPGTGVFYPPNLLFQLLPPQLAATAFILLHLPLACAGAALLAQVLGASSRAAAFAAITYSTSGYLLSLHAGEYYFASAAWLPLAVALLVRLEERRSLGRAIAAALGLALMFFNGEPQTIFFALALAAALLARRPDRWLRSARALALATALGVALAAIQWLPILYYLRDSSRAAGFAVEGLSDWSIHPLRLLELVLPTPFGVGYPDDDFWGTAFVGGSLPLPWAASLYVGPIAVVLAACALRRGARAAAILLGAAALSAGLAMGPRTPLLRFWIDWIPFANRFRYPEKFLVVTTLAVCLLGALGFDAVEERARRAIALCGGLVALLGAAAAALWWRAPEVLAFVAGPLRATGSEATPAQAFAGLLGALGHGALLCAALALILLVRRRNAVLAQRLVLAVALVDGLSTGLGLLSYGDASFLHAPPAALGALEALVPPGSAGRLSRAPGCDTFFDRGGEGTRLERLRAWEWQSGRTNLWTLYGVSYAFGYGHSIQPEKQLAQGALSAGAAERLSGAAVRVSCERDHFQLTAVADPMPRVAIVRAEQVTRAELWRRLGRPDFDYRRTALVEEPTRGGGGAGTAALQLDAPEQVVIRTGGEGGLLVLADSFAAGWTATVDGRPEPILHADLLWRGVPVPPGEHQVAFRYRTPGLSAGAAVSLAAALFVAALLALRPRRRGGGEIAASPRS